MRDKIRKVCYLGMIWVLCFMAGCREKQTISLQEDRGDAQQLSTEKEHESKEQPEETAKEVVVYICGAIAHPGVYEVPVGSRLITVLEAAGGFTKEADQTYLNQAEPLQDGARIYVPTEEETKQEVEKGVEESNTNTQGKINLNTASKEELMTITGVGEAKADSIIRYREEHGGFQKVDEIMKIEGIKEGVFNKIKEQIDVK